MNDFLERKREPGGSNWIPRIICLLLAVLLWIYVMGEQNPITERDFVVALGQRNLAPNMSASAVPAPCSPTCRNRRSRPT